MQIAALYDIHGNLPALEAVLEDVRRAGADEIVVGGDVLPGPMPCETLDLLLSLDIPTRFLMGNGDRETLAQRAGQGSPAVPPVFREVMRWAGEQLTDGHVTSIAAWPAAQTASLATLGSILFCHATPRNDTEIFTRLTPDERLEPVFRGVTADVVICGHTHMQFDRRVGRLRVVNAGSVGMPFGDPGAYWLLIGPTIEARHTPYDLERAAERVRATRYPQAAEFASGNIVQPPSEAQMLEAFARVEIK